MIGIAKDRNVTGRRTSDGGVVEPRVSDVHVELVHYTSIAALKSILRTDMLWATRASHLNDSSEMQLIWQPMKEICTRFVEEAIVLAHPTHSDEAAKYAALDGPMIAGLIKDKLFGGSGDAGWAVPFVTSFTTHEDKYHSDHGMLSQWRGYAGEDGVAIVFDARQMEEKLLWEHESYEYFSCSISDAVYYSDEINLLKRFPGLFGAVKVYVRHVIEGLSVNDKAVLSNLHVMAKQLLPVVGRFKHQAFHEENECRIIVGIPHETYHEAMLKSREQPIKPFKKIHYRSGKCGSIPYIRLFETVHQGDYEQKGSLPITRIIVGPSRNQDANVDVVGTLVLEFSADREIKVQPSDIPYVATA